MSPEINGNPPSVTKRKKNREKKSKPQAAPLEFNMSNCSYFQPSPSFPTMSIPEIGPYYTYLSPYAGANEPMSLPVYPLNYGSYYPARSPGLAFMGAARPAAAPDADSAEYLSLPVGHAGRGGDDAEKRRYSDPGLPNDSDYDDVDSGNSVGSGKMIAKLAQQVNLLREGNRKLGREVTEMRMELNVLKQQQNSRHFEREYEPGMLADIIREVRDAARVREDALLGRVKHMIEEKQLSLSHLQLVSEKNRNNDRILKLEEQLKNMSVNSSRLEDNTDHSNGEEGVNAARQVLELEREALELRRELQDTRAKKDEADQKLIQLDKKLSTILRRNDISMSDMSEDGKTNSIDSLSVTTSSSISQIVPPRVTLSGPVTDL